MSFVVDSSNRYVVKTRGWSGRGTFEIVGWTDGYVPVILNHRTGRVEPVTEHTIHDGGIWEIVPAGGAS